MTMNNMVHVHSPERDNVSYFNISSTITPTIMSSTWQRIKHTFSRIPDTLQEPLLQRSRARETKCCIIDLIVSVFQSPKNNDLYEYMDDSRYTIETPPPYSDPEHTYSPDNGSDHRNTCSLNDTSDQSAPSPPMLGSMTSLSAQKIIFREQLQTNPWRA